jgi:hypothetical protein
MSPGAAAAVGGLSKTEAMNRSPQTKARNPSEKAT